MYKDWEENDVKVEEFMLEDAEYVVVAYGSASRVAKEAILNLREKGYKVGMIRPITLFPFPKKSIKNLDYGKVKAIIDIEMTIPAQMREDIELQVMERCPVYEYGRSGGCLLDDEGVYEAIYEIVSGGE
jgi:2-oxoglutarate ferredoxin oxidoreductase subunit alpha